MRPALVGQFGSAPLSAPQVEFLLSALGQALKDLRTLPGYMGPGYVAEIRTEVQWSALRVWVELYEDSGELWTRSAAVYYSPDDVSADDLVLTTLAQVESASTSALRPWEFVETLGPEDWPAFTAVLDDVGPDNFANLVSLLFLAAL